MAYSSGSIVERANLLGYMSLLNDQSIKEMVGELALHDDTPSFYQAIPSKKALDIRSIQLSGEHDGFTEVLTVDGGRITAKHELDDAHGHPIEVRAAFFQVVAQLTSISRMESVKQASFIDPREIERCSEILGEHRGVIPIKNLSIRESTPRDAHRRFLHNILDANDHALNTTLAWINSECETGLNTVSCTQCGAETDLGTYPFRCDCSECGSDMYLVDSLGLYQFRASDGDVVQQSVLSLMEHLVLIGKIKEFVDNGWHLRTLFVKDGPLAMFRSHPEFLSALRALFSESGYFSKVALVGIEKSGNVVNYMSSMARWSQPHTAMIADQSFLDEYVQSTSSNSGFASDA